VPIVFQTWRGWPLTAEYRIPAAAPRAPGKGAKTVVVRNSAWTKLTSGFRYAGTGRTHSVVDVDVLQKRMRNADDDSTGGCSPERCYRKAAKGVGAIAYPYQIAAVSVLFQNHTGAAILNLNYVEMWPQLLILNGRYRRTVGRVKFKDSRGRKALVANLHQIVDLAEEKDSGVAEAQRQASVAVNTPTEVGLLYSPTK